MKIYIWIIIALLYCSLAHASDESVFINMEISISPLPHKVAVGYPLDLSDNYYFVKSINRIFFQETPVIAKIVEAEFSKDKVVFTLESSKYGKGIITIFSSNNLKNISNDEIKLVINKSISEDKLANVVVDTKSNIFHLATCNHLPSNGNREYLLKKHALSNGLKECSVCFRKQLYLPEYELEKKIQNKYAAELRHYNPVLLNSSEQSRVDRIGNMILAGWPYPLIGYDYKFTVVESKEINAYSIAAGSIFLTTGLLNAAENDSELEAVLAHEIAHIEKRHSLQSHKFAVANQQSRQALAGLAGIAVGAAAISNRNNNYAIGAGIASSVMIATAIVQHLHQNGFSKEQEHEADNYAASYFINSNKSLTPLKSILSKLMYYNLCSANNPDPENLTHPLLKSRLKEIDKLKISFPKAAFYHLSIDKMPIQIKILSISERNDESEVVFYSSDLSASRNFTSNGGYLRIINGSKVDDFTLDSNTLISDSWGGFITGKSKARGSVILDSTTLELNNDYKDEKGQSTGSITRKLITSSFY